jgi:hypothetical protein
VTEARDPAGSRMFSRAELLGGGLPARRASTILFAIEGEAARLVAASRVTRAAYIGERTTAEHEQDFLKAMRSGATLPDPPTIVDLERFADRWARLVPEADDVRAELARMLGAKYRFRAGDVPGIRRALHLDEPGVAAAFERVQGKPIASIHVAALPARDRVRWRLAAATRRFDRLSPFWIAFVLTFTETLGEGMLSLPLALAGFGLLPGILLILVLGGMNVLTVGAMAEAVVRNGSIRYGLAYLSRLIQELLGRSPAVAVGVVIAVDAFFAFWFYFLGFGSVLEGATGIPVGIWILLLFGVCVVLLRKETLDDTIASAVLTAAVVFVLAVILTVWSLLAMDPANFAPVPGPAGGGLPDLAVVGLVFGVVLMAFFGHTTSANSAKLLLNVEPTGKALIRGSVAAMATVVVFYTISTMAIIGAVGPQPLLETSGTAFTPLAAVLGPGASVIAVAYTVLAIGIGSLWVTLGTYNLVVEQLPRAETGGAVGGGGAVRRALAWFGATRPRRLVAGFAPAALVVVLLEIVVLLGVDDFVGAIAFAGTLTVPIITGVLPMLLVAAARRTGEYVPAPVTAILGHSIVVAVMVALFVLGIGAHVLLWAGAVERLAAAGFAVGAVVLVLVAIRNRAFRPRATVELKVDERSRRTTISVVGDGQVIQPPTTVEPGGAQAVGAAGVPVGAWRRLRVWPHQVSTDGWSATLPASVVIRDADGERVVAVAAGADPVFVDVTGDASTVELRLTPR